MGGAVMTIGACRIPATVANFRCSKGPDRGKDAGLAVIRIWVGALA